MDSNHYVNVDTLYRLYTHHIDFLGTLAQGLFRSDDSCFSSDLLEAFTPRTLFCVIVTLLAVCVIWTILGHMTVRADGVFIWLRDKHGQLPFKPSTHVHIPSFYFFSRLPLRRLRGYPLLFFSLSSA